MDETLVYFGGEVKALGEMKIAGYLVMYGDEKNVDLQGDFFTPETDFDLVGDSDKRFGYHDHGMDVTFKNQKIGVGTLTKKEKGVWLEAQLNRSSEYAQMVYDLAEKGELGLSSGSIAHLVRREKVGKSYKFTHWPIGEWSTTVQPAEPRTKRVFPLKSLFAAEEEITGELPQEEVPEVTGKNSIVSIPNGADLFRDALSVRRLSAYDLFGAAQCAFRDIAKGAGATPVTGVAVDIRGMVTQVASVFAGSLADLVTEQILDYLADRKPDEEFYVKGFEHAALHSFLVHGALATNGPVLNHSEEMATVTGEFAQIADSVLKGIDDFRGRFERRAQYRLAMKDGRVLSAANIAMLNGACDHTTKIRDAAEAIHGQLLTLIDVGTPKPKSVEPAELPVEPEIDAEADALKARIAKMTEMRLDYMRTEAAAYATA